MSGVKRYMRRSPDTGVLGSGFGLSDYVLASDYDKLECLVEAGHKLSMDAACGEITALEAERDALRAQVEVMRALLSGVCDYADDLLTDVNRAWSYCGSTGADEVHKDADYLAARAALQVEP